LNHPVIIIYFCHQSSTGVLDKTLDRVLEQYISPIRTKLVLEAFDVCVMTECLSICKTESRFWQRSSCKCS